MSKPITRRRLTAAVLSSAASLPGMAPPQQSRPTPDDLEQARQNVRRNRELLTNYRIEMALEPAFQFKA